MNAVIAGGHGSPNVASSTVAATPRRHGRVARSSRPPIAYRSPCPRPARRSRAPTADRRRQLRLPAHPARRRPDLRRRRPNGRRNRCAAPARESLPANGIPARRRRPGWSPSRTVGRQQRVAHRRRGERLRARREDGAQPGSGGPAASAAASPRAEAIPPAASAGTDARSSTSVSSGSVATRGSPCPPPSAPRATSTSTPASTARWAASTSATCVAAVSPASWARRPQDQSSPKLTHSNAGRARTATSSSSGRAVATQCASPMPNGRSTAGRAAARAPARLALRNYPSRSCRAHLRATPPRRAGRRPRHPLARSRSARQCPSPGTTWLPTSHPVMLRRCYTWLVTM